MALPAIAAGAVRAYGAYKTAKETYDGAKKAKEVYDGAKNLKKARGMSANVLDQSKGAVEAFDGGVSHRSPGGAQGQEVDMPQLAGAFPEQPGETAPGMTPDEHGLINGQLNSMMGGITDAMQGEYAPQGPEQNTPEM